jgi:hypothetical protein
MRAMVCIPCRSRALASRRAILCLPLTSPCLKELRRRWGVNRVGDAVIATLDEDLYFTGFGRPHIWAQCVAHLEGFVHPIPQVSLTESKALQRDMHQMEQYCSFSAQCADAAVKVSKCQLLFIHALRLQLLDSSSLCFVLCACVCVCLCVSVCMVIRVWSVLCVPPTS